MSARGPMDPEKPLPKPRAALDVQTWREVGYLLSSSVVGTLGFGYVVVTVSVSGRGRR